MAVAMATSRRTCRKHDGMRPPTFRPNRSFGRRDMAFPIFSNVCDHVTVILVLTCKIGSSVRPPHAHNCRMFNAHGNRITAEKMSGTWWDANTQVSSQSVHWLASYGISNIFQYGGRLPFWILIILIFLSVTVIEVLICWCVPNFIIQNWFTRSASRRP